jgi:ectoine hydroxylase-related dioxygenase (phytanoyl-CoA dioxygenase family)
MFNGLLWTQPGSAEQLWHVDGEHLYSDTDPAQSMAVTWGANTTACRRADNLPAHCLNVFVPLVDITADNGATEFLLGSHKRTGGGTELVWQDVGHRAAIGMEHDTPICPVLPAGSVLLFDYRILHRGLAHSGTKPRPVLCATFTSASITWSLRVACTSYDRIRVGWLGAE